MKIVKNILTIIFVLDALLFFLIAGLIGGFDNAFKKFREVIDLILKD